MNRTLCAHIVAACALLTSCGDDVDKEPAKLAQDEFAELDAVIEKFVSDHGLEGATAVVVQRDKGQVHQSGYGAFEKDRLSLIASGSKILSAGVLLALEDQGVLDLDAPVSDVLSALGMKKTDITTAQCLSNSSGMPGFTREIYGPYICQYVDRGSLQSCTKSLYLADDVTDRAAPDSEFRYGGAQWQLAGGVAETASGKSWETLIRETYIDPCDVPSLGYTNQYERAQLAGDERGYPSYFQANLANLPPTKNPNVEGGAYINAADYGKLLLMHLRGGLCGENRVLSERAVARMQEDRIASAYGGKTINPEFAGYGFGWWIDREHPGIVIDPGLYGARAWLDNNRGYAAMLVIEADEATGNQLRAAVQPLLEAIFDGE